MEASVDTVRDLIAGDCRNIMDVMPRGFCDLVFCSPPYVDARTYGIDYRLKGEQWVAWAADRFMSSLRICKGLVAWVVQGRTRKYEWDATPAMLMVELQRRGACLRSPPIFHRVGIPGSGGPDWLRSDYEWIVCATAERGRLPWSDATAMGHEPKWKPGGRMSNRHADGRRVNAQLSAQPKSGWGKDGKRRNAETKPALGGKVHSKRDPDCMREQVYLPPKVANPGNVIHCKVGGGRMGSKLAHENEAPFPERLAEFFIRSFCPPGGRVLDPFCGSGTTLAVAKRLGRNSTGIDIRQSQIDLSQRRLDEVGVEASCAAE